VGSVHAGLAERGVSGDQRHLRHAYAVLRVVLPGQLARDAEADAEPGPAHGV
jgi:hypothetical protein